MNTLLGIRTPRAATHILAGGDYTSINGRTADSYMTSLNPAEGLWIASDNWQNSNMCGGVKNLAGICLLPY